MTASLGRTLGEWNDGPLDGFLFGELGFKPANRPGIGAFVIRKIIGNQIVLSILIDIEGSYAMNPKDLISNQMHFPSSSGRILVRTFEPEDFPNIRTHKVKIPVPIDIMKDAVDTTRLHFCIFGFGFGNDEGLVIFGAKIHEELSLSGEKDLLLTIPSVIMGSGRIYMRSGIDFLTSPIRILGKKKMGRCKK
jgi:hypothetical protein